MHYLTLDTNTWIYLANGTEPVRLLAFIKQEVEKGNITILIPEVIVKEWNKNKDKAVKQGGLKHYKDVNEALERILKLLGDKGERDVFGFLLPEDENKDYFKDFIEKFKNKKKEIEDAITDNIGLIDELFAHKTTVVIKILDEIFLKAGQFALDKKAPFRNRNSFADALIVFSFIDFVQTNGIEGALFISYNTEDFCEKRDTKKILHPDLEPDFQNSKSKFYTIVGEALNTIEKDILSKEELEYIIEQQDKARADDDIEYCESCDDNGYYNEIYFSKHELIDERIKYDVNDLNQLEFEFAKNQPKTSSEPYHSSIEAGSCSWCGLKHFKCVECGSLNSVWEGEYNKKKECEGGCGLTYFVDYFMDHDYTEECVYRILEDTDTCQKCGDEFIPDGSGSNICEKCEAEYSYGG